MSPSHFEYLKLFKLSSLSERKKKKQTLRDKTNFESTKWNNYLSEVEEQRIHFEMASFADGGNYK